MSTMEQVVYKKLSITKPHNVFEGLFFNIMGQTPLVIKGKKDHEQCLKTYRLIRDELFLEARGKLKTKMNEFSIDLAKRISLYEDQTYLSDKTSPVEALKFLMNENNLNQSKLKKELGKVSQSYLSEVLSEKKPISIELAKKLANFFSVKPILFVDL